MGGSGALTGREAGFGRALGLFTGLTAGSMLSNLFPYRPQATHPPVTDQARAKAPFYKRAIWEDIVKDWQSLPTAQKWQVGTGGGMALLSLLHALTRGGMWGPLLGLGGAGVAAHGAWPALQPMVQQFLKSRAGPTPPAMPRVPQAIAKAQLGQHLQALKPNLAQSFGARALGIDIEGQRKRMIGLLSPGGAAPGAVKAGASRYREAAMLPTVMGELRRRDMGPPAGLVAPGREWQGAPGNSFNGGPAAAALSAWPAAMFPQPLRPRRRRRRPASSPASCPTTPPPS
jgi:hypothetical protein